MVKIRVNEIINCFFTNYKDNLVQVHVIERETIEECFGRVYALRRSARYDSARRYDFEGSYEEQYRTWERKNETIEMYYGSGTVD